MGSVRWKIRIDPHNSETCVIINIKKSTETGSPKSIMKTSTRSKKDVIKYFSTAVFARDTTTVQLLKRNWGEIYIYYFFFFLRNVFKTKYSRTGEIVKRNNGKKRRANDNNGRETE